MSPDYQPLLPPLLKPGEIVRIVSPASTPDKDGLDACVDLITAAGLKAELGRHVLAKHGFLAGTDEQRLSDLNDALRDPSVRAILASRGGKGSYRIADQMDFAAAKRDPKFVIGFSDITALHMALWKHARLGGIHGANTASDAADEVNARLFGLIMDGRCPDIASDPTEPTSALTTAGQARGPLVGGNLDTLAITAGWALPNLAGAILFLEGVGMGRGHIDRQLTMLTKSGALRGIAGIALGQFIGNADQSASYAIDVLRLNLAPLGVPILGGLPCGHGSRNLCFKIGAEVVLDTTKASLHFHDATGAS